MFFVYFKILFIEKGISASLPAEQLEQLEPDNAQYAGRYAYDNIDRMYQRESEYSS
jgi:hypothetical protein